MDAPKNLHANRPTKAFTRRCFLRSSALAASTAATLGFPYLGRVLGANGRVAVGVIGAGGKGESDTNYTANAGADVLALSDVDGNTLRARGNQYPRARQYLDYRKMLDEVGRSLDAVTVSTPDHVHALAAAAAITMGKHAYVQKPLVHSVYEARYLRDLARRHKVITQMGNQGSSEDGLRRAVEVVHAGLIGNVSQIHVWSNRPIWPQGIERPPGEDPVPAYLNWDLWIGPAPMRPYKRGVYHPFKWRGWIDFGTGALGDMACHTVNMPFRAARLGYPTAVEAEDNSGMNRETYPLSSKLRFDFPAREGLPPTKLWWYDGNPSDPRSFRPSSDITREITEMTGQLPGSGALLIGDRGRIFSPDDYGAQFYVRLNGETEFKSSSNHDAVKAIPQSIPRNPARGDTDFRQHAEWVQAIKTNNPELPYSRFDIAAYLTEIILLGCVALRVGKGVTMQWDGPRMHSPNIKEAAQFVNYPFRPGWKL